MMDSQHAYSMIERGGLVAGMRGNFPPSVALTIAEILLSEGIPVVELTMNSTEPIETMQALKAEFGDAACVGMGTVLDTPTARRVVHAGADMVVSPAFSAEVVDYVQRANVLMIPGVITPSEAVNAWGTGVKLLKIFPVGTLGVDYFSAVRQPLDHIKFMCNGGTSDANVGAFIKAGAVACGMAGWLTGDGSMPLETIRQRARTLRRIVDETRETSGVVS